MIERTDKDWSLEVGKENGIELAVSSHMSIRLTYLLREDILE